MTRRGDGGVGGEGRGGGMVGDAGRRAHTSNNKYRPALPTHSPINNIITERVRARVYGWFYLNFSSCKAASTRCHFHARHDKAKAQRR